METIEVFKDWSTSETAGILGCADAKVRQLKGEHSEQLVEGTHFFKDGTNTRWTEAGIKKLAEWVKTEKAIALRSQAITTQPETKIELHETQIKTEPMGKMLDGYADLPHVLGEAIADKMLYADFLEKTNAVVVRKLTKAVLNSKPNLEVSVKEAFDFLDAIAG